MRGRQAPSCHTSALTTSRESDVDLSVAADVLTTLLDPAVLWPACATASDPRDVEARLARSTPADLTDRVTTPGFAAGTRGTAPWTGSTGIGSTGSE